MQGTEYQYPHTLFARVYCRAPGGMDAAINNTPNLQEECEIVQNATDLCRALGIDRPKIAVLSAVETVSSKLKWTKDAAALWLPSRADGAAARTASCAVAQISVHWRSANE